MRVGLSNDRGKRLPPEDNVAVLCRPRKKEHPSVMQDCVALICTKYTIVGFYTDGTCNTWTGLGGWKYRDLLEPLPVGAKLTLEQE